jgi:arabinan endo-1,5-alpha-L-arabinosidase
VKDRSRMRIVALALGLASASYMQAQASKEAPQALELSGAFQGTHDPSIGVDHGIYYVFATGAAYAPRPEGSPPPKPGDPKPVAIGQFPIRCSKDLHQWSRCGEVFPAIPEWIQKMSPKTAELWAPDISYFDGLYHLYYAFSIFGKNTSGIALVTNETLNGSSPNYKWVDRGLVLRSSQQDDFNAIDPNLILDDKGEAWLSFGSFWTGIKMRHLDRKTGLLSQNDTKLYSLATRARSSSIEPRSPDLPPDTEAIEAPFVLRHDDFYYLFVSWDLCCRGLKSTYKTMVGRSKAVTGPYLDRDGHPMMEGGGTAVLLANETWLGPGGESLLHMLDEDFIVFHAYSAKDGHPALHISTVGWKDGWPSASLEGDAAPPRTTGRTGSGN